MEDTNIWGYVATVLGSLIAAWGLQAAARVQKGSRESQMMDRLQEQLKSSDEKIARVEKDASERIAAAEKAQREADEERRRERREDQERMERLEARDRILIPHILRLNRHIDDELGPPSPPIPEIIERVIREHERNI